MTLRLKTECWHQRVIIVVMAFLAVFIARWTVQTLSDEPEIALIRGEPWEDMRQRSSAKIGPAIPGHHWFRMPESDARLRFIDPQYGFTTPLARFFTISFDNERVRNIRMSPQVEPLLLDDALKIVLDLQDQWQRKGWFVTNPKSDPPLADTPQWRDQLRDVNKGGTTFWQADDKYQVMLILNRFRDYKRPTEERYMITLAIASPWVRGEEH